MIGVVARGENRGLGHLTWEVVRALQPDRVLVVDVGGRDRGHELHRDRYPDATFVTWSPDCTLDERTCREWLDGLDVVYLAETPYDERFPQWARDARARCVVHAMPEFWRYGHLPFDAVWNPTTWRMDLLPALAHVVPVPVPLDRWPTPAKERPGPPTFLHVAGHRTTGDRNGSVLLARALRHVTQPMRVRVLAQGSFPRLRAPLHVDLEVSTAGPNSYWTMYDDADVLVLPRRYGGLSLPVLEAAGAGLALVCSDVEPNRTWPIVPVPARPRTSLRTPGGEVRSFEADPRRLAHFLDVLAERDELRWQHQREARAWAEANSWDVLRDEWRARLCG